MRVPDITKFIEIYPMTYVEGQELITVIKDDEGKVLQAHAMKVENEALLQKIKDIYDMADEHLEFTLTQNGLHKRTTEDHLQSIACQAWGQMQPQCKTTNIKSRFKK